MRLGWNWTLINNENICGLQWAIYEHGSVVERITISLLSKKRSGTVNISANTTTLYKYSITEYGENGECTISLSYSTGSINTICCVVPTFLLLSGLVWYYVYSFLFFLLFYSSFSWFQIEIVAMVVASFFLVISVAVGMMVRQKAIKRKVSK